MSSLNFWINPLSAEHKLRILRDYSSRGVARLLTTSNTTDMPAHPLALSFVLGLGDKVDWYGRPPVSMKREHEARLLRLVVRNWGAPLDKLDLNMLVLRYGCLPQDMHDEALLLTERSIYSDKEYIMKEISDKVPPEILSRLDESLKKLETALLEKDVMMPQHLRNTHSLLISYPETVHLLDDEEIARIIDAAEIHTKTEIVKAAAKGKTASRKKVDVGDL